MAYKATTAIPENRERTQNGINFDNTDGTTKDIWTPASGKRVSLNDVVLSVINKDGSSYIIVAVQVYIGGSWRTLVPVAVGPTDSRQFAHNFGGRIYSAAGDGSNARIRAVRTGTSTNWESQIIITGEEG